MKKKVKKNLTRNFFFVSLHRNQKKFKQIKTYDTYDSKKLRAVRLMLDGQCSLNYAVAICFNDPNEALKALNEIRDAFRTSYQ